MWKIYNQPRVRRDAGQVTPRCVNRDVGQVTPRRVNRDARQVTTSHVSGKIWDSYNHPCVHGDVEHVTISHVYMQMWDMLQSAMCTQRWETIHHLKQLQPCTCLNFYKAKLVHNILFWNATAEYLSRLVQSHATNSRRLNLLRLLSLC